MHEQTLSFIVAYVFITCSYLDMRFWLSERRKTETYCRLRKEMESDRRERRQDTGRKRVSGWRERKRERLLQRAPWYRSWDWWTTEQIRVAFQIHLNWMLSGGSRDRAPFSLFKTKTVNVCVCIQGNSSFRKHIIQLTIWQNSILYLPEGKNDTILVVLAATLLK